MLRAAIVALSLVLGWMPQVTRDRMPAAIPQAAGTASITGRVTIDTDGTPHPVRRASVTLESDVLTTPLHADTDTDGRYRFTSLPAGSFRIRVEKAGFVPRLADPRRAFERPVAFELASGQAVTRDLRMVRGAALEGRITTHAGHPAVNVVVSAMRFAYDSNGRRAQMVRQTRTDDRGRYRIHSLPAGEYYLEGAPDPLDALRQAPVPGRQAVTLSRAFYPGVPQVEGGQSLSLSIGQNRTDLEFALPAVPTAALRGQIVDSSGRPGGTVFARLQRVGGPVGEVRGAMNPSGNDFLYPAVPPGDYWLMGIARPTPDAQPEFGVSRITVIGQDMSDLSLTTARGATVQGRITVEQATAQLAGGLEVVAHQTEYELPSLPGSTPGAGTTAPVSPDGTFSFSSLFGPRLLRVQGLPSGWAVKSATLDGQDVTDTPFDFRGRESAMDLRLVVTSRTATITGVVRDDSGRVADRARIVVFSESEQRWGWHSRMVKTTESSADGRYAITGVIDGSYLIVAVPFMEEGSWMDTTMLQRLRPFASPLAVANPVTQTANLVVKPW